MGGVPRSTYMPYPFQILQNDKDVIIVYQFATAFRHIFVDGKDEAPLDSWMGWSNGALGRRHVRRRGHGPERPVVARPRRQLRERQRARSPSATRRSVRTICSTKRRSTTRPCSRGRGRSACRCIASSMRSSRFLEFKCEPYAEEKTLRPSAQTRYRSPRRNHQPMKQQAITAGVLVAGVLMGSAAALAPFSASAQKQPRTAWGDPDISGAYAEFTTAPLERDAKLGDKEFFTAAEHEEFAKTRMSQAFSDDDTEVGTAADVHYSMGQFALSENEGVTSLNLRTSIVTQPKNGRIPPLTAEATARRDALAATRKGKEFDGPEMRSLTERCILWPSTIAPILPRGYNSNLQIFQSPGYVIIQGEMGDPRSDSDGRPQAAREAAAAMERHVGRPLGRRDVRRRDGGLPPADCVAQRDARTCTSPNASRASTRTRSSTRSRSTDPKTWAEPWGGVYPLTIARRPAVRVRLHGRQLRHGEHLVGCAYRRAGSREAAVARGGASSHAGHPVQLLEAAPIGCPDRRDDQRRSRQIPCRRRPASPESARPNACFARRSLRDAHRGN